jgi:hypothetical protein
VHCDVIAKLGDLRGAERRLSSMQQSLASLQRSLLTESAALTNSRLQVA